MTTVSGPFKGVCVVQQPIEIVAAISADIAAYPEWFYKCIEAKKVPKNDSTDLDFIISNRKLTDPNRLSSALNLAGQHSINSTEPT